LLLFSDIGSSVKKIHIPNEAMRVMMRIMKKRPSHPILGSIIPARIPTRIPAIMQKIATFLWDNLDFLWQ
jgi:hypothetical protein